jgi:flagellar basal-body rod protein FlgF
MLRGIYTAASGMLANQRRSEALTNNLANVNSTGYKADDAVLRSFPDYMITETHAKQPPLPPDADAPALPANTPIGSLSNGVYTHEMVPNFRQGDLFETGNPLDAAIYDDNLPTVDVNGKQVKPRLFFAIQKGGETHYTRNGNFTLDAQNNLVTADGSFVLDDLGKKITLPSDQFLIDAQGRLSDEHGVPLTVPDPNQPNTPHPLKLQLVQVNNPLDMVKGENNAFLWQGQAQPQPVTGSNFQIRQGQVERSNVDAEQTMVDLMQTERSFEANQKVLTAYNQSLDKLFEAARIG